MKKLFLPTDEDGNIRIFGLSLLLLLVPVALYFFIHIPNREDYFTHQYLRLLGDMSLQVTEKVNNFERILENASLNVPDAVTKDLLDRNDEGRSGISLSSINEKEYPSPLGLLSKVIAKVDSVEDNQYIEEVITPWFEKRIERSFELIPDVEPVATLIKFNEREVIEEAYRGKFDGFIPAEDTLGLDLYTRLRIEMQREKDAYWLHFYSEVYRHDYKYTVYIHAKSRLDDIMEPILGRSRFDEVMLVDEDGSVRYQQQRSELLATNLDSIGTDHGQHVHAAALSMASNVGVVDIGGAGYKLFTQPLRLPVRSVDGRLFGMDSDAGENGENSSSGAGEIFEQSSWVIAGFVQRDRFYSQTRYISISWIISFFFILIFTIVCLPLIKLWYMGSYELLKRRDVVLLLFCSVLGTALAVLGLLDLTYYSEIKKNLDVKLEVVADEIENQFLEELHYAYLQLVAFKELDHAGKKILTREETLGKDIPFDESPFTSLTLVDSMGMQRVKWSSGNQATPLIDVSSRSYFNRVRESALWDVATPDSLKNLAESLNLPSPSSNRLFVEPIFSLNTGRNETILAIPADKHAVATLNTRFASLFKPILPLNMSMAVVDEAGNVLFHSDENRNLRENFIAECNDQGSLRSSLLLGVEKSMDVDYLGSGHRLYIKPLDDIPWRMLIFLDKRFVRTVNLHVLSEAMLLFTMYLVVFIGLMLGRMWWTHFTKKEKMYENKRGIKPDSVVIWPDDEKSSAYFQVYLGNAILCGTMFLNVLLAQAHQMLHIAFLVPLFGFILTFFNLKLPARVAEIDDDAVDRNDRFIYGIWLRIKHFPSASILGIIILILGWMLSGLSHLFDTSNLREFGAVWILTIGLILSFWIITSPYINDKPDAFRKRYVRAVLSLVLLTSAMPAMSMFKITYDAEGKLWIRQQLTHLLEKVNEPASRNAARSAAALRFSEKWNQEIVHYSVPSVVDSLLAVKDSLLAVEDSVLAVVDSLLAVGDSPLAVGDSGQTDVQGAWFYGLMSAIRPAYNEFSHLSSSHNEKALQEDAYEWEESDTSLQVITPHAVLNAEIPRFKMIAFLSSTQSKLVWFIGAAIMIVVLVGLINTISNHVVLLHVEDPVRLEAKYLASGALNKDLLVIGPPSTGKSQLFARKAHVDVVDLTKYSEASALEKVRPKRFTRTWVLDHFEHKIEDPEWNRAKLKLLQRICTSGQDKLKQVVVVSTSDPLELIQMHANAITEAANQETSENGAEEKNVTEQEGAPLEFSMWVNVFSSFLRIHFSNPGNPKAFEKFLKGREDREKSEKLKNNVEELCSILKQECSTMSILQVIGKNLVKLKRFAELSPDELKSMILEWAEPYYNSIWQASSTDEKMLLSQLAQEGFVNFDTKNPKTLRELLRKGLMVRDPELRLMNNSFKAFLLTPKIRKEVRDHVHKRGPSAWDKMKVPLLTVLIGVSLFVFITQQDVFNVALAWISALAAALPALFRLFAFMPGKKE